MIKYRSEYSLTELLQDSRESTVDLHHPDFELVLREVLYKQGLIYSVDSIKAWYDKLINQPRICKKLQFEDGTRVSLSFIKFYYVSALYNSADLPMLSDFCDFKQSLSIVNKSFVTIRKPLRIYGSSVYIRDTFLLTPSGYRRFGSDR
jgi:hypothetical protein